MKVQDDKATCLAIAQQIERDVAGAANHRKFNTGMMVVIMFMMAGSLIRSFENGRAIREDFELSKTNYAQLNGIKEKQDLYRVQYLDYIKDMVDAMNKLQADNPHLKVPKAPVPRGVVELGVSESDLRRIPQPAPTPTPIVKKEVVVKYKRAKSTPSPKPWYDFFKQTR